MGADDLTITITYTPVDYTLTVITKYADGSVDETTETFTKHINDPYNVTPAEVDGYSWTADAAVEGTMPAGDLTITITYTPHAAGITIIFKYADGSQAAPSKLIDTYSVNEEYDVTAEVEDIPGYSWNSDVELTGTLTSESLVITVTYTPIDYTATFLNNDGTEFASEDFAYGAAITAPAGEPEAPEGYSFAGWSRTSGATAPDASLGNMDIDGVTFYPVFSINSYTLTINYVDKDGTAVTQAYSQSYEYGADYYVESPDLTADGWKLARSDDQAIGGTMGAQDEEFTVLYIGKVTVTYTDADGEHTIEGFPGDPITETPTPATVDGQVFNGWVDGNNDPVDFPTVIPDDDVTITATYRVLPKLIARNTETTTVDRTDYIVYGFADADGDVYVTLDKLMNVFLDVEGDGYMVITPVDTYNNNGLYGTGSIVTVYDNYDNSVVETFTVVVFGDVNGDGRVTTADVSAIRAEFAGNTGWSDETDPEYNKYKALAADANHNGGIDNGDISTVRSHVAYVTTINQNP